MSASRWSPACAAYACWITRCEQPAVDELLQRWDGAAMPRYGLPLISVVMPVYRPPVELLRAAIDSVRAQVYTHWQLCIVDDGSGDHRIEALLREYLRQDARVRTRLRPANGGIAVATNEALGMASGAFVAFMDQDDLLPAHALLQVAVTLDAQPRTKLLYTDSDRLDEAGERRDPFFKPSWDPDLLLAQNYCNHLSVLSLPLVRELGGLREGFDGAQDHDLLLRATRGLQADEIVHVPAILYHWRELPSSVSRTALGTAVRHARSAVRERLAADGVRAEVGAAPGAQLFSRIVRHPGPGTRIGVIVHGDNADIRGATCAALATPSAGDTAVRVHEATSGPEENSVHAAIERAARGADCDVLVLLQAGWRPASLDWLAQLAAQALRPDLGLVGVRLAEPDDAGAGALRPGRCWQQRWIVDTFPHAALPGDRGYHAGACLDRRVSVLHGTCLALRASTWAVLVPLDRAFHSPEFLGADLSLQIARNGLHALWCAGIVLERCAAAEPPAGSPPDRPGEAECFERKWGGVLRCDPYFNPNLAWFLQSEAQACTPPAERC